MERRHSNNYSATFEQLLHNSALKLPQVLKPGEIWDGHITVSERTLEEAKDGLVVYVLRDSFKKKPLTARVRFPKKDQV